MVENPYAKEIGNRDPLTLLGETPGRIRVALTELGPEGCDRSYAPGKWTARQIAVHLAQFEMMAAARIRMALAETGYVAQNFDQDAWQVIEIATSAVEAFDVYAGLRRMTVKMLRGLPASAFDRELTHPLFGAISVRWLLGQIAGHELRHLDQLRSISRAAP